MHYLCETQIDIMDFGLGIGIVLDKPHKQHIPQQFLCLSNTTGKNIPAKTIVSVSFIKGWWEITHIFN